MYNGKYLNDQQVIAGATSHSRINNNPRTVSDAVYQGDTSGSDFVDNGPSTTTTASTTTTPMTTTTASTTTTTAATQAANYWKICNEEDQSKQCPTDSDACWNLLAQKCAWNGNVNGDNNWNICADNVPENEQCPTDSQACWDNLAQMCGW